MKIFIDSADIGEIREAASLGIIDGVTTNPSLVAKTGRRFEDVLADICETVNGPISAEVISTRADEMVAEGQRLAKLHPNIVVKCPMIAEGLKATARLSSEGIKVNVTLVFQAAQALLAAKAGAAFVSPFVGRLDDVGEDGMAMVAQLVEIFANYDYDCEVLVASVRQPGALHHRRAHGRRRGHVPVQRHHAAHQAPADRYRPGALPGRLGKSEEVAPARSCPSSPLTSSAAAATAAGERPACSFARAPIRRVRALSK
jgi:transaldolase